MKIALLSFNFGQYCIRLANGLSRVAEVMLMLPRAISEPYRDGLEPQVELFQFDAPRLRQPFGQMRMVSGILGRLKQFDPDVVHFQAGHLWFNLVWPFFRAYPTVLTIHESRHHLGDQDSLKTPQWVMDLGYRRADRIIVHGENLREAVVTDLGFPRETIDVVPPVPDIVLDRSIDRETEDPRLVLFFGRIWPYKGLDVLIRAEPKITKRVPGAQIAVVGRGEKIDRYRAAMVHPENFIVRYGYVSDSELASWFSRAAVVVLPYIEGSISGVVAVAYTFGKPVVATAVGILPEIVEHGRTGLIVPPYDADGLAEAVASLLEDDELRHQFGRNALAKVESDFDPVSVARASLPTYEEAIVSHARSRAKR